LISQDPAEETREQRELFNDDNLAEDNGVDLVGRAESISAIVIRRSSPVRHFIACENRDRGDNENLWKMGFSGRSVRIAVRSNAR
jgi:hypothetical protein